MQARRKPAVVLLSTAAVAAASLFALAPFAASLQLLATVTGHPSLGRFAGETLAVETRLLELPTRHGPVSARVYAPATTHATLLVVPGMHGGGLEEPRQAVFASRFASTGVTVIVVAPPDLRALRLTPRTTDQIEDAVAWVTSNPSLAPRGQVGLAGISFGGGLAIVAAGRPRLDGRLDYVLSLGGHGDLERVLRYLATGRLPDGTRRPPHNYAAVLAALAALPWIVPADQAVAVERALRVYLDAALETQTDSVRLIAEARQAARGLAEPGRAIVTAAVKEDVATLGRFVEPAVVHLAADPALSPERSPPPRVPVFLLHGATDNVIPSSETGQLAAHLAGAGVPVRALLTPMLSHVGVQADVGLQDYWQLVHFWKHLRSAMGPDAVLVAPALPTAP